MPTPTPDYEYLIVSHGASGWRFLEGVSAHLQRVLDDPHMADYAAEGWELWQINTLNGRGKNGFLLMFRRPRD